MVYVNELLIKIKAVGLAATLAKIREKHKFNVQRVQIGYYINIFGKMSHYPASYQDKLSLAIPAWINAMSTN